MSKNKDRLPVPRVDPGALPKLAQRISGAKLVYGKPVRVGERAVVPVASMRVSGGFGFGSGTGPDEEGGDGGGGGGTLRARPAGFIEVGPEGARYQPIEPPAPPRDRRTALVATGAAAAGFLAATGLLAARAAVRQLGGPRRRGRAALPSLRR
jgi:Sporulation protein YtfJ (Spore_YtfJ)